MDIYKKDQFNQPMGKTKMLSSTGGVGSIITTKWGGFIMPLSIDNWAFLKVATNKTSESEFDIKKIRNENGVELIDDSRFVSFLSLKKNFTNLKCFAVIPQIQLNYYNRLNLFDNPLYKKVLANSGAHLSEEMFYVPAICFPRWFISANNELKPLDEWHSIWKQNRCNDAKEKYFAPPRDPNKKTSRKIKDDTLDDDSVYGLLKQVPLVLICENGHISDIPWYNYFCAELEHEKLAAENGFELFHYSCKDCSKGGRHNLKWLNSRNQAESWGTLKCTKCGRTVSLSGIMNIKPFCRGERPWSGVDNQFDVCKTNGKNSKMRVAMLTSNSIYYSIEFSSLFIPPEFIVRKAGVLTEEASYVLSRISNIYQKLSNSLTKELFWELRYPNYHRLRDDAEINWRITSLTEIDCDNIKTHFLNEIEEVQDDDNPLSSYRFSEYEVFTDASNRSRRDENGNLEFNDVVIPDNLFDYFSSIKQVDTLALTKIQLGFGRVHMPTAKIQNGQVVPPGDELKNIFNTTPEDIYVLPANRQYGEGLFFAFNQDKINQWSDTYDLEEYYDCSVDAGSIGESLYSEIQLYGKAKFFLLHTFSHLIMKELEFSCGYPTASLSERLYYSDKMCGVLIYTAEGSEGSMGGLVWQGQPHLIENIIRSAIKRAENCSSDPLCWENHDGLNRASCFSCAMVAETSCEHFNLGLDRRALVDENFGFFKELL